MKEWQLRRQKIQDLKILFENPSLLKPRLSRHIANGVFKDDKVQQQLLLFWFSCMITVFFPPPQQSQ